MPCYPILNDDGEQVGFMCGEHLELPWCSCGAGIADYLCDFPVGKKGTCDAKLCKKCSLEIKDDVHLCPEHAVFFKDNSDSLYMQREIKNRHERNIKRD